MNMEFQILDWIHIAMDADGECLCRGYREV